MENYPACKELNADSKLSFRLMFHPIHGRLAGVMHNMRKLNTENKLHTSLFSVLSVRLREGYTIRDISLTKGMIHVRNFDHFSLSVLK